MLAISVIALSTVIGLCGGPIWVAMTCGLALAMIALFDRAPSLRRALAINSATAVASVGASIALAQMASVGTFAVGRLLGEVLLA
jgi:hypothetical protein